MKLRMTDSSLDTRRGLAAAVRAHLEWEAELGGYGLEPVSVPAAPPRAADAPLPPASPPQAAPPGAAVVEPAPALAEAAPGAAQTQRPSLSVLREQVAACTRCELHKQRTQTVFARGSESAALMFIGEGPGRDEDRLGEPFVGAAGQLLDKMVAGMGFAREDVYVANVVKCRPPNNRTPLPDEAGACSGYLQAQIEAVRPQVLVALGRCAAENMGLVPPSGGRWRGRWGTYMQVPVMPTYHPAFLLRSPEFKRPVWDDLKAVLSRLGREVPAGKPAKDRQS